MTSRIVLHRDGTRSYFLGDREVSQEEYHARVKNRLDLSEQSVPFSPASGSWPMTSLALSVHENKVAEAREQCRQHGIGAEYQDNGLCTNLSRSDRKKLMKLRGMHDNKAGYGD